MKFLTLFALLFTMACGDNGTHYHYADPPAPTTVIHQRTTVTRTRTVPVVQDDYTYPSNPVLPPTRIGVSSASVPVSVPVQIQKQNTTYQERTTVSPIVEQVNNNNAVKAKSSAALSVPQDNSFSSRTNIKDFTVRDTTQPKKTATGFGASVAPAPAPSSSSWGKAAASAPTSSWGAPKASAPAAPRPSSSWGSAAASKPTSSWGRK